MPNVEFPIGELHRSVHFSPGDRVRLDAPSPILYPKNRSFPPTGTVLGMDEQTNKFGLGYYIVKVDKPLYYDQPERDGSVSIVLLNEIRESEGNMRRVYDPVDVPGVSFWRKLLFFV